MAVLLAVDNLMVILQILRGNVDTLTVHKNMFDWRINARYIRINPRAWTPTGQICMRVEIYLCHNYQGEWFHKKTKHYPNFCKWTNVNNIAKKKNIGSGEAVLCRKYCFSHRRKQPTLRDVITGFPAKGRLRNECRNSILMTRHYSAPLSASN